MTIRKSLRLALFGLGLLALAGCSAISSIQSASKPLATFELTPLPAGVVPATRGRRHLEIALPTATGALDTDSIMIKPTQLQLESLPDARWVNETTELVQLLLVRSLTNTGRFALVASEGLGPPPDYVLMTDLRAFQAEVIGEDVVVVIRSTMTLLRDTDGVVVSSGSFAHTVAVPDNSTNRIVAAFDEAMTLHLTEAVEWLVRNSGG